MAHSPNANQQAGHGEHPTPATYIKIAFLLAALTGIEVGVFYIDVLEPAFLPIFLILSIAKFALVILFYMHLKFDHRLFSTVFIGGLMLALVITVALLALFQVLSSKANPPDAGGGHGSIIREEPNGLASASIDLGDPRWTDPSSTRS